MGVWCQTVFIRYLLFGLIINILVLYPFINSIQYHYFYYIAGYCVKIVTGTSNISKWSDGYLQVSINNVQQIALKEFDYGEIVLDKCFSRIESISVTNQNENAWIGQIMVTKGTLPMRLKCNDCTGGLYQGGIIVDGDGNIQDTTHPTCLNGNSCTLVISGIQRIVHILSNKFLIIFG